MFKESPIICKFNELILKNTTPDRSMSHDPTLFPRLKYERICGLTNLVINYVWLTVVYNFENIYDNMQ